MSITDNKAVYIHYEVKSDNGEVIDTSKGTDPLAYLHGHKNVIPGLEKALTDKAVGDKFQVTVAPDDAYGERNEELIQAFPMDQFDQKEEVKLGAQFQFTTPQGPGIASVSKIEDDQVFLDMNHPLAGETLHFDIEVVEIRDASEEEISHGHIHGPGGHNH